MKYVRYLAYLRCGWFVHQVVIDIAQLAKVRVDDCNISDVHNEIDAMHLASRLSEFIYCITGRIAAS